MQGFLIFFFLLYMPELKLFLEDSTFNHTLNANRFIPSCRGVVTVITAIFQLFSSLLLEFGPIPYRWSATLLFAACPDIWTYEPAKLPRMNFKGDAAAPSSALTGFLAMFYPRRRDATADSRDYRACLQPLGGRREPRHQRVSKRRCTPLIKATWTLIHWSISGR